MASTICQVSQSLRRLTLEWTFTSGDVGLSFLSELADSQVASLEYINFNHNPDWFFNEECVDTLCQVLQRQGSLQVLRLYECYLTDDQVQKIHAAVQTQDCRVITTKQEDEAYRKELEEIKKAEEAAKKAEEDAKKAAAEAAKK